jgi:hypothetical protein
VVDEEALFYDLTVILHTLSLELGGCVGAIADRTVGPVLNCCFETAVLLNNNYIMITYGLQSLFRTAAGLRP